MKISNCWPVEDFVKSFLGRSEVDRVKVPYHVVGSDKEVAAEELDQSQTG